MAAAGFHGGGGWHGGWHGGGWHGGGWGHGWHGRVTASAGGFYPWYGLWRFLYDPFWAYGYDSGLCLWSARGGIRFGRLRAGSGRVWT